MRHFVRTVLALTLLSLLGSCHTTVHDRGMMRHAGDDVYWVKEDLPLYVLVDSEVDSKYAEAVEEACWLWNHAVGVHILDTVVYDFSVPSPKVVGFVAVSVTQLGQTRNGATINGLTKSYFHRGSARLKYAAVWFDLELPDSELFRVATHEIGHVLGLSHDVYDCDSIMHPHTVMCGGPFQIQDDDVERIRAMVGSATNLGSILVP